MDVGELLSYQPNRGTKRPRDDEDEDLKARRKQASARERSRHREEEAAALEETDDEKKKLLQIVDKEGEEEEEEDEPLDESSVKKMILTFEKRSYKNQELRIKFPDNPEKFMESELDLNDIIQEMHVIATMPDLYHLLVELNAVQSLLGLLGHDNTDVSIAVVDLLQELTDIDTLHESEEGAEVLIDALVDGQVVALLVQNLERLDEGVKEEADGVHYTLAIVENMAEFRPEMCTEAAQQGLVQWLLKRLKAKMPFDANKLYCSEVLAILLQNNDDNRELLGELDGIDVLLQQLSVFKRHNPSTAEEQEMMENLFDSLCSCLMLSSNRDRFLKGEGLQLMNLMLREKKISRSSALKVLDHAMIGPEGTDNCHKFVDILGLRTIFPLFMKSPKKIKKVGTTEKEHEGHGAPGRDHRRRHGGRVLPPPPGRRSLRSAAHLLHHGRDLQCQRPADPAEGPSDSEHERQLHQNRPAHHKGVRREHRGREEPGVPRERAEADSGAAGQLLRQRVGARAPRRRPRGSDSLGEQFHGVPSH
ncbi:beta-catenin-like protein 1 isoform X2 [Pelodiscus sinensis]|uniref:beta-catenin-like protein 1 isoform X2 n=1 Tax=Pelodiscus sinensis TaxID=13735 RepID=UPI003F6D800C